MSALSSLEQRDSQITMAMALASNLEGTIGTQPQGISLGGFTDTCALREPDGTIRNHIVAMDATMVFPS